MHDVTNANSASTQKGPIPASRSCERGDVYPKVGTGEVCTTYLGIHALVAMWFWVLIEVEQDQGSSAEGERVAEAYGGTG